MTFSGRVRETAAIETLIQRVGAGRGGVVVLVGPDGSGKTSLADLASDLGAGSGIAVIRLSADSFVSASVAWAQLLRGSAAPADVGSVDPDEAARYVVTAGRRLIVIDDVDRGGPAAEAMLAALAAAAPSGAVGVLATSSVPSGLVGDVRIGRLSEREIGAVVGENRPEVRRVLWLAAQGNPRRAIELAGIVAQEADPVGALALAVTSSRGFLEVDPMTVTLLEEAALSVTSDTDRARLLARLAFELLGDPSTVARRASLIGQALALAEGIHDDRLRAEVLDSRLHSMWDADSNDERLEQAEQLIASARTGGDAELERKGLFWRFVGLMEQGRIGEAESALAAFGREATAAGDLVGEVVVAARQAMLCILRGRFDEAASLVRAVAKQGNRIGLSDTERLVGTLGGTIAGYTGDLDACRDGVEALFSFARRLPGHCYEATAARVLVLLGRVDEAALELDRSLPAALTGTGPRWLGVMADFAAVAVAARRRDECVSIYAALLPYAGRMVVFGGANSVNGPVTRYLGMLESQIGLHEAAVAHLTDAVEFEQRIGALPGLVESSFELADALDARGDGDDRTRAGEIRERAHALGARLGMRVPLRFGAAGDDRWTLVRESDAGDWHLDAGDEHARLWHRIGFDYLRALLAAPGQEISALDLTANGPGLVATTAEPVLDNQARVTFRRRLVDLDAELDAADRAGNADRAVRAADERAAILDELRQATGLGGRPRRSSADGERARVNVTRALRAAVSAISTAAPQCGAHLDASIRTGGTCRYQPPPGPTMRWRL